MSTQLSRTFRHVIVVFQGAHMRLRLKEIRESQFLTQRELAAKAHVGVSTIVRLEKGQQTPAFQTIKRLAAALGVGPSELVLRDGQ